MKYAKSLGSPIGPAANVASPDRNASSASAAATASDSTSTRTHASTADGRRTSCTNKKKNVAKSRYRSDLPTPWAGSSAASSDSRTSAQSAATGQAFGGRRSGS